MSLPRYPKYKESRVPWLGQVPEHWTVTRFSRVMLAIKDGTHGTYPRVDNGFPLLSAKNVLDGQIEISDSESLISHSDHDEIVSNGFPAKGDILLTIVGTIGRSCVFDREYPIAFQRSVCFIRLHKDFDPRYFYYFTQSKFFQEQLISKSKSAAQAGVYMGDVASTNTLYPTAKDEQSAIAAFLDRETGKIDALIAEQEKLRTLLAEKRQATISHAVTRGLNPAAPLKDSGVEWLGEVPAHWDILRLNNLFKEVIESGEDDLPILSVSIHDGVSDKELNDEELDRKVSRSDDRSKYKKVMPGDLVYNMMRAWQGGFGTVKTVGMVSPAYVVARPTRQILTDFIECLLRTPNAVTEMKRRSRGVTDFRLRLYWEEFKEIQVAIPPFSEQCKIIKGFTDYLSHIEKLGNEATSAIELLKERRCALIAAAVTGQIDVRGVVVDPSFPAIAEPC